MLCLGIGRVANGQRDTALGRGTVSLVNADAQLPEIFRKIGDRGSDLSLDRGENGIRVSSPFVGIGLEPFERVLDTCGADITEALRGQGDSNRNVIRRCVSRVRIPPSPPSKPHQTVRFFFFS